MGPRAKKHRQTPEAGKVKKRILPGGLQNKALPTFVEF